MQLQNETEALACTVSQAPVLCCCGCTSQAKSFKEGTASPNNDAFCGAQHPQSAASQREKHKSQVA